MATTPPKVLTIAGSDPTGGAGMQLDLQVLALHGVHGMGVPTALTVQNTHGVRTVLPVFPNVVLDQLRYLLTDIRPDAIKIGMLATDDVTLRVADVLRDLDVPRVVDPILKPTSGPPLLERRAWGNLLERVCRGATLMTPNLAEATALTGQTDPEAAAAELLAVGAHAVLLKGGHAAGAPDDLLLTRDGPVWLRASRRIDTDGEGGGAHGTGCALSTAIAARLARGEPLLAAVEGAKRFVEGALARAFAAGSGQRLLGLHALEVPAPANDAPDTRAGDAPA
jgi:hydroxymethylpyrimidine/phosphomethylpyrimidine kinase